MAVKKEKTKYNRSFVYSPTDSDIETYLNIMNGKSKKKPYMKDYKALHHIEGLTDSAISVYEAIRNLMGMNYINTLKMKDKKAESIGKTRNTEKDTIIGHSMVITNTVLQEWIGPKSHHTIKSALDLLCDMGFIKCSTSTIKNSRKVTLLRDMEQYQPEEIKAIQKLIKIKQQEENLQTYSESNNNEDNNDNDEDEFSDIVF